MGFYNKIQYRKNKVQSVSIKVNDFVEFDPYLFIKK